MSNLEIVALDTSTPQLLAPQAGDGYKATLVWNNGATTFTGMLFDLTNTASAAGSKLLDMQVGGNSIFSVDPDTSSPGLTVSNASAATLFSVTNSTISGTRTLALTPAANTSALTASSYSLTGSNAQSLLDLAGTWDTTGTPTALKLNVTDTASGSGSKWIDLQRNGNTLFSISAQSGFVARPVINVNRYAYFTGQTGGYVGFGATENEVNVSIGLSTSAGQVIVSAGGSFNFNNNNSNIPTGSTDLSLFRDAADTLAQRRGTNDQTFRIYNTYTDSTNTFERGKIAWESNILRIGTEKGVVGGTARALEFQTDGTTRMTIGGTGSNMTIASISNLFLDTTTYFASTTAANSRVAIANGVAVGSAYQYLFSSTTGAQGTADLGLFRSAAGLAKVTNGSTGFGALELGRTLTGTDTDPALFVQGDWSTTGTATLIKANLNADTGPSDAASLLMDLQVGGVSKIATRKDGRLYATSISSISTIGVFHTSSINLANETFSFLRGTGPNQPFAVLSSVSGVSRFSLATNAVVTWTSGAASSVSSTDELVLAKDAAGTLAQRNAANAQTFRIYNTYTDTTNTFERGKIAWESDILRIGTEKGVVGGTARALEFQTDGVTRLSIDASLSNVRVGGAYYVGTASDTGIANGTGASLSIRRGGTEYLNLTANLLAARDALNIAVGTTTGTKIGTATSQKLGFFDATPVVQQNGTGETTGFTAGAGTAVNDDSTFTGNVGATAYRINDIVKALKNLGLLAQ